MLDALVAGTTDPEILADLARGTLRRTVPALREALSGRFRARHAFPVSQLLAHLDHLDEAAESITLLGVQAARSPWGCPRPDTRARHILRSAYPRPLLENGPSRSNAQTPGPLPAVYR
ncbi:MAG: hypothetical protein HY217_00780 [Candidatus Rokubacteria bacterium]|nr:hypothetical protein [Candidatus Rokubacteria bacterium]